MSHNSMTSKINYKYILILTFIIFGSINPIFSQVPDPSVPPRLVNDFASVLSDTQKNQLEQYLVAYSDSTSTQITVVIMPDLEGYDVGDMAQRIGQKWGVGQKNTSNGLVILIKPKKGNEQGKAFIATGYGLEEILTDAVTNRIVDNEMIPYFAENKYYEGIIAGVNIVRDLLLGRYTADQYTKKSDKKGAGFLPIIIFLIFIIIAIFGKKGGNNNHTIGGKGNLPFWLLLSMLGSGRGSSSGSWGGFSGGSGGFGGGGGGFGGFGGGGFGGGGAGGSW